MAKSTRERGTRNGNGARLPPLAATRSAWISLIAFGIALAACGGDTPPRSSDHSESAPQRGDPAATAGRGSTTLLCSRIEDDEALTPGGAEALENPGIQAANSERRCMRGFGVDMPIGELRGFYRSTLADLGYELTTYREGDGIMQGNLSRTFLRASKPGRQVNLQIDEFDPDETTLARHTANVKLQIDAARD